MRHTEKRWLVPLAAIPLLATAVVGCSGASDAPQSPQASAASPTSATSPTSAPISTTLKVWDYYTSSAKGWQDVMDGANKAFETAHPGVTIEYVAQSGDNATYSQLVSATFLSGDGPDVMMLQPGHDGVLQFADGLEPLDPFFDESFKSQISGFADSSVDGKTLGVPNGGGAIVLMYNKTLLAKAGVTTLPTTFAELQTTLKKLKDKGVTPFAGGVSGGGDLTVWAFSYLFPGVGTTTDADALGNGTMKWTDPLVKQTLDAWVSLWKDKYYPVAAQSQDIGAGWNDFMGGKGAFGLIPLADLRHAGESFGADNVGALTSLGITQPKATYQGYGAVSVWSVPNYSKNKELAAEYIKAVTSRDVQQQLFDKLAWPPANNTVDLSGGVAASVPAFGKTLDALTHSGPTQLNVHQKIPAAVATELKRQIQSVILGQTSMDEALKAIQAVQDSL